MSAEPSQPDRTNDGKHEEPDSELVQHANNALGVSHAISLLADTDRFNPRENFAPFNLQVSDDNRHWNDNGSLRAGDVVGLFAVVYRETRNNAAQLILDLIAELGDEDQAVLSPESELDLGELDGDIPVNCFPAVARMEIEAIAHIEGQPYALSALSVLGNFSGAMGKGVVIPSKPGMVTTPNLYILAEAETGDGKTVTDNWASSPVDNFQLEQHAKFKEIQPKLKAELSLIELEIKGLNARKLTTDAERNEYLDAMAKVEAAKSVLTKQIKPPCYKLGNATSAALADVMSCNDSTAMSHTDDARGIVAIILGRYENKGHVDDEFYIVSYSVVPHYRTDRISRGTTILDRPCLSILWLIQDDMYSQLWDKKALVKGGFLPRFLTCHTHTKATHLCRQIKQFPKDVAFNYESRIRELLTTYRMHGGEPYVVPITDEARDIFFDYSDRIADRRIAGEFSSVENRFAKRWAENAWRVGLVLHGAENGSQAHVVAVTAETARCAVALVSWFAVQQLEILRAQQGKETGSKEDAAQSLARKHGRINVRSLKKAGICADDAEAQQLLDKLVEEDLLEGYDYKGRGRGTRYYIVPQHGKR